MSKIDPILNKTSTNNDSLGLEGVGNSMVNFQKYSFLTSSLIVALIYFIFTIIFILVAGTIGAMVSYFLQRYNLINWVVNLALWQKVTIFGVITFLTANFCLFEAEAIVAKLIKTKSNDSKTTDLRSLLKIRPRNWQKVFYSIALFILTTVIGYFFIVNYISWNFNQFWSQ
jgi:hypothetical protein